MAVSAVEWLVETQQRSGGWDEPTSRARGSRATSISAAAYRDVFPVTALGRILGADGERRLLVLVPLRIEQLALGEAPGSGVHPDGMDPVARDRGCTGPRP